MINYFPGVIENIQSVEAIFIGFISVVLLSLVLFGSVSCDTKSVACQCDKILKLFRFISDRMKGTQGEFAEYQGDLH